MEISLKTSQKFCVKQVWEPPKCIPEIPQPQNTVFKLQQLKKDVFP